MRTRLFVFDVNTLVSAFIVGSHTNALAFDRAKKLGRILISNPIQQELSDVFTRSKFDRYVSLNDRVSFLSYLDQQLLHWPEAIEKIKACRDPKDDRYLELAVAAQASCIITGDPDLLILHPFRNIPILNAAAFLTHFESSV